MKKTTIQSFFGRCGVAAVALSLTAGSLAGAPTGIPPAEAASPISPDGRLARHLPWHERDAEWRNRARKVLLKARRVDIQKKIHEGGNYIKEYFNLYEDRNVRDDKHRDELIKTYGDQLKRFWWARRNSNLDGNYDWEGTANNRWMINHAELRDYVFARALAPENRTKLHSLANNYLYKKRTWDNLDFSVGWGIRLDRMPNSVGNDINSLNALNRSDTLARFGGPFPDAEVERRRREIHECIAAARKFRTGHIHKQTEEFTEIMTDYANLVEFAVISGMKDNDPKFRNPEFQLGGRYYGLKHAREARLNHEIPDLIKHAPLGKPGGSFDHLVSYVRGKYGHGAADYLKRSPKAKNLKWSWHLMQWWDFGPNRLANVKHMQTSGTNPICKDHKTRRPALPGQPRRP